jgi:hypothetical protein
MANYVQVSIELERPNQPLAHTLRSLQPIHLADAHLSIDIAIAGKVNDNLIARIAHQLNSKILKSRKLSLNKVFRKEAQSPLQKKASLHFTPIYFAFLNLLSSIKSFVENLVNNIVGSLKIFRRLKYYKWIDGPEQGDILSVQ